MRNSPGIESRLQSVGINLTPQRVAVAEVLLDRPRHLTADQVHRLVNAGRRRVSVATIYNTLKLFSTHGLLREVVVEQGHVFYDSATHPHHHFYNVDSGELHDIAANELRISRLPDLPEGRELAGVDVVIRVRRGSKGD